MSTFNPPVKSSESLHYSLQKARQEDADEVGTFVVNCLREAFTKDLKLGPQETFKSSEFLEAYKEYRRQSIGNANNLCRILREQTSNEILGYIEFGQKNIYKGVSGCEFEILCLFTNPTLKGRGIGKMLVSNAIKEMVELGSLTIGSDRVGVMTQAGSPYIRFYEKIGAQRQGDHEMKWVSDYFGMLQDFRLLSIPFLLLSNLLLIFPIRLGALSLPVLHCFLKQRKWKRWSILQILQHIKGYFGTTCSCTQCIITNDRNKLYKKTFSLCYFVEHVSKDRPVSKYGL